MEPRGQRWGDKWGSGPGPPRMPHSEPSLPSGPRPLPHTVGRGGVGSSREQGHNARPVCTLRALSMLMRTVSLQESGFIFLSRSTGQFFWLSTGLES